MLTRFVYRQRYGTSSVTNRSSKFHQVLRNEHLAGKVPLNFLNMTDVVIIEMRQYHRLDIGARRQFSDFVGQQVLLDVVAK